MTANGDVVQKRDKSCAERVRGAWASRRADLKEILRRMREVPNWEGDDEYADLHEYGLGIWYTPVGTYPKQKEGWWTYQFSTGGPGDELRFFGAWPPGRGKSHKERRPERVEFWFLDWFDGAKLDVTDDEVARQVWDYIEEVLDWKEVPEEDLEGPRDDESADEEA